MPDVPPDEAEPIPEPPPADPDSPERRDLEAEPSTRCLNCGASLPGRFCPNCGQKDQPLRTPIHRFVVDTLSEYLGLDGRVWPTLRLLLEPGRLTQAYIRGQRERYARPLRIYLTSSVLFFLVLGLADPIGAIRGAMDVDDLPPDSSMAAGVYLDRLDSLVAVEADEDRRQRVLVDSLQERVDSLEATFTADSLAGVFEADVESLNSRIDLLADEREELTDVQSDLRRMTGSTSDKRLAWRRDLVASYPEDSLIHPYDVVTAAELVIDGRDDDPGPFGPDWLTGGESARRLREARTNAERSDAGWALGKDVIRHLPSVIFLLLPVFALLMKLLYVRRGWYYAEHLVFALHTHAFAFAMFTLIALFIWGTQGADWAGVAVLIVQWVIPLYFIVAMKRVYAQGWIKTLVKAYFLAWMYFFVLTGGLVLAVGLAAAVG